MARIDNLINVNSVWNHTTSGSTLESATLKMWIYSGTQGGAASATNALGANESRPVQPTYSLSGTASTNGSTKSVQFDLSPLIKDYVESKLYGGYNSDNIAWVDIQVTTTIGATQSILASEHYMAVDGYEYVMDTVGSPIDDVVRISNVHILYLEGTTPSIPVLTNDAVSYAYELNGVEVHTGVVNDGDDLEEQIAYINAGAKEVDKVTIALSDGNSQTLTLEKVCAGRYESKRLTFVNKHGAFQDVWFFTNSKRQLQVKSDSWNRRNAISGTTYNVPTNVRNVSQVNETITINSGFYPESNNVVFEELMQSNSVWVWDNNRTFPIIIKESSFNFKDSNTDKMINYTMKFEYAFNKMKSL